MGVAFSSRSCSVSWLVAGVVLDIVSSRVFSCYDLPWYRGIVWFVVLQVGKRESRMVVVIEAEEAVGKS